MDVIMLSRLQFAVATLFHFIFVPLTLGLSILVAIMETIYVRTGNEEYRTMAKFLGEDLSHQFCRGRRDRHHPGVSIWHQLVGLFHLCGRHFRFPVGN